jgi:hypothetical protein
MGFAPGAPTSVTASLPSTYGNTTASVSWVAPVAVGSPELNDYVVQYSSDSGSTFTTFSDSVSTSTSVTVTGLTNGTAYVFRVAAKNTIGTGAFSSNSNSVTPLFGKVPTPVVSDIIETTNSIPWCFDNYASIDQANGYVYNYYNFNVDAPNDQSGNCHGWVGQAENVYKETYLYVSKTGWANSDPIFLAETTNITPVTTTTTTAAPPPPTTTADPCAGVTCSNSCSNTAGYTDNGIQTANDPFGNCPGCTGTTYRLWTHPCCPSLACWTGNCGTCPPAPTTAAPTTAAPCTALYYNSGRKCYPGAGNCFQVDYRATSCAITQNVYCDGPGC